MQSPPVALCLGGAACVWDDLERAREIVGEREVIVVASNFAGVSYPGRLDAWVTLHPERMRAWEADRAARKLNTDYLTFSGRALHNTTARLVLDRYRAASGIYAAQVALEVLGACGAILCGVPMDEDAGHIHWPGEWPVLSRYRTAVEAIRAPIKSMSGWTADVLGLPDAEWIEGL